MVEKGESCVSRFGLKNLPNLIVSKKSGIVCPILLYDCQNCPQVWFKIEHIWNNWCVGKFFI